MSTLLTDKRREPAKAIALCVPTLGMVSIYWHNAMSELMRCGKPMNRAIVERCAKGGRVDESRNMLVRWALELSDPIVTHVFFVDDDVIVPHDALLRLLEHDRPIVSGLYYGKTRARQPLLLREPYAGVPASLPDDGLVECYAHGMGCTLIAREVFEAITEPWYRTDDGTTTGHEHKTQTEDVWFCELAAKAGYRPAVDVGLRCLHYDKDTDIGYPLDAWRRFVRGEQPFPTEVAA